VLYRSQTNIPPIKNEILLNLIQKADLEIEKKARQRCFAGIPEM